MVAQNAHHDMLNPVPVSGGKQEYLAADEDCGR